MTSVPARVTRPARLARARGRAALSVADVSREVALADLHYGYSSRLGSFGFRWLTRKLAQREEIAGLCWRYGR